MNQPLNIIFHWHMHQPFYREADSGQYHLPWVYLHAMKDYTDMAHILEQVPGARAVINFVPSLTVQIEDYANRVNAWLSAPETHEMPDPLLAALAHDQTLYSTDERALILKSCFRLNHERNLHRYPAFSRLWHIAEHTKQHNAHHYLSNQYFADLVTWYHLGWLGETVRKHHFIARRLIQKGELYTQQDRFDLITLISQLLKEIPEKYRKLQQEKKIEISTTPYAHPIIPLMLDFHSAQERIPDAHIPETSYPHGRARAINHIQLAQTTHERTFGVPVTGCWPAEGAVSQETVALLAETGFKWCATGEAVLHHSLHYNPREHHDQGLYHPWEVGSGDHTLPCFFRDDRLSDLIGFEYSRWQTTDAVNHFMHELSGIRHRTQGCQAPVVSIIMDGENAWEHFHENGLPFLTELYTRISEDKHYKLTTYDAYLADHAKAMRPLAHVVAGSWVYGNLSTWIGDDAKTRAWELLIEAKSSLEKCWPKMGQQQRQAADEQLRICEGSDWCWWFGDYNPSDVVQDFDNLYRQHLRKLYTIMGANTPASLEAQLSSGGGTAEDGGTMRRNTPTA
ncbi:MAG: glycoside hydrolase family 57 [Zetaproteobacteria bacterium]|nr:glycoside hydrolase family 57 [Zetaproteobacteria bacterium]